HHRVHAIQQMVWEIPHITVVLCFQGSFRKHHPGGFMPRKIADVVPIHFVVHSQGLHDDRAYVPEVPNDQDFFHISSRFSSPESRMTTTIRVLPCPEWHPCISRILCDGMPTTGRRARCPPGVSFPIVFCPCHLPGI